MALGLTQLLSDRRFLPLFFTQFFGAFNDNAFKLSMLTLISYRLSHTQAQSGYYQALAGALFILPFFLLSATSGQLVDKYDKAFLARLVKVFELLLMIVGSCALYFQSLPLLLLILTGMGIHSTFFGPIKYAILPDLLAKEDLLAATGLVEASTFIGILLGTTLGTLSIGTAASTPYAAMFMVLTAAFLGLVASLFIPSVASGCSSLRVNFNIFSATFLMLRQASKVPGILLVILSLSWFWLLGTVIVTKLPDYTHFVLGANPNVFALFLALFSIGIALGSITIKFILRGQNRLTMVPYAMFGCTVFTADLYWASPNVSLASSLQGITELLSGFNGWRLALDFFCLAICAGLYTVPLYTFLQVASQSENRARIIAANNIYNAFFMVLGTLWLMALVYWNFSIPQVFLLLALVNGMVAIYLKVFGRL
ncbi:MAG: MFS transporter [Legionella sp.]|jgi:MFS family permease